MKKYILILLFTALLEASNAFADIVVIAHQGVAKMDAKTVGKIFTGKVISINGTNVIAVNLKNTNVRSKFLQSFVGLDDEKYVAYWTVRKYIGKGTPPKELNSAAEVIQYVQTTPGAIGYIDESDLRSGLNIITRQ